MAIKNKHSTRVHMLNQFEVEMLQVIEQHYTWTTEKVQDVYIDVKSYDKTINILYGATQLACDPHDLIEVFNGFKRFEK